MIPPNFIRKLNLTCLITGQIAAATATIQGEKNPEPFPNILFFVIGAVVHGPMAVGTNPAHEIDVVEAAVRKTSNMVRFQKRRAIGFAKGSVLATAFADPVSALENIGPHEFATLVVTVLGFLCTAIGGASSCGECLRS